LGHLSGREGLEEEEVTDPTIIEGTAVDVTERSVAVVQPQQGGMDVYERPRVDPLRYLGTMSDADFRGEVAVIKAGTDRIGQIYKEVMRPDIDYGIIPGTKNPSLLQPGAERLAMMARLIPRHEQRISYTPGETGWPEEVRVDTQTFLHAGALDGPVVGSAVASCTSYEDRYLYRSSERVCPKCQKPVIIRGNPQYAPRTRGREGDVLPGYDGGGWLCWKKKDGCGATFPDNDLAITGQAVGKVFVDNPRGLINTLAQISAKRGFVGAIRHTLGITDLFTQDVEDMPPPENASAAPAPENRPATASRAPSGGDGTPKAQSTSGGPAQTRGASSATKGTQAMFEGPVMKDPDGLRSTADGKKLEFAIKVGSSKHNVELWDEFGARMYPLLHEGTIVGVDGVRVEEDWPGRGDKPMKKVIRNVERVIIDGQTHTPAAVAPQPKQQGAFDDEDGPLPFDDEPPPPPQRTLITGDAGGQADVFGVLADAGWDTTPKGARFLALEIEPNPGTYVKVACSEEDARDSIVGDDDLCLFAIGTRVRVVGGWNKTGTIIVTPGMVMGA
jgi:hypothetical protein